MFVFDLQEKPIPNLKLPSVIPSSNRIVDNKNPHCGGPVLDVDKSYMSSSFGLPVLASTVQCSIGRVQITWLRPEITHGSMGTGRGRYHRLVRNLRS